MTVAFNTQKNKEFLWKVMYNNKLFDGLDNSLSQNIQLYFENKMDEIDKNKKNTDTLISLNKRVAFEMMVDIKTKFIPPQLNNNMITSQEILQNRQNLFDQQLNSMKNDFDSLMYAPKPSIIDFSDKKPTVALTNANDSTSAKTDEDNLDIERLLAETISKRENMVLTINEADKNKAASWVNNNREVASNALASAPASLGSASLASASLAPAPLASAPLASASLAKPLKIGDDISFIEGEDNQKMKKNVRFQNLNSFIPINVLESSIKEEEEEEISYKENIQRQLTAINEKLNKILELILQPKSLLE
jgi:hypothetical protein